jgi:hypothetical protein
MLVVSLNVGENFAVIAVKDNNEGDDFWIFICEEILVMVEEVNKINYWGKEVYKGEQIIVGKYYKR